MLCTEVISRSVCEHREHLGLVPCAQEPGSIGRVTELLCFGVLGKGLPRGGLWNWLSRTAGLTGCGGGSGGGVQGGKEPQGQRCVDTSRIRWLGIDK